MSDVELRYGMDGHAQFVEVGVCPACRQHPPAKGEVLCEPCLAPPEHRDWTFKPEDRETMAATKRWMEMAPEVSTTSPARAYQSLLERRRCP